MCPESILQRILDYENRPDPYPLFAELRKTPAARFDDEFVVSGFWEVQALLHDPRVSSDARNRSKAGSYGTSDSEALPPSLLRLDPPEHDRLRRMANRCFGPPNEPRRVAEMHDELCEIISELIDGVGDTERIDLVDQVSYPFPVTVICRLLGVPREDEARFHVWADTIAASLDPMPGEDPSERMQVTAKARTELGLYLAGLIEERRKNPRDDMLSELAALDGPDGSMTTMELLSIAVLLLIAGHETTVNLITNGMLTLLRNPETLQRLRDTPELALPIVEELLRYEPPVQMMPNRTTVAEIDIADLTIPKGASLWLVPAAANRDPARFQHPDLFDPDRNDVGHLGFGSGIHSCFGAPLARLEAQIALSELARRLVNPRLLEDPPEYRQNAILRGPRHLPITCSDIA